MFKKSYALTFLFISVAAYCFIQNFYYDEGSNTLSSLIYAYDSASSSRKPLCIVDGNEVLSLVADLQFKIPINTQNLESTIQDVQVDFSENSIANMEMKIVSIICIYTPEKCANQNYSAYSHFQYNPASYTGREALDFHIRPPLNIVPLADPELNSQLDNFLQNPKTIELKENIQVVFKEGKFFYRRTYLIVNTKNLLEEKNLNMQYSTAYITQGTDQNFDNIIKGVAQYVQGLKPECLEP